MKNPIDTLDYRDTNKNVTKLLTFYKNKYYTRYFQNGLHHREDGPAIIQPDGTQHYYIHGIQQS